MHQVEVVPGRPHRHRQRGAGQPDLQRLLGGDGVGPGGVHRPPDAQHRCPAGDSSHERGRYPRARPTVTPWIRCRRTRPSSWPAARRRGSAVRPSRSCAVGGRPILAAVLDAVARRRPADRRRPAAAGAARRRPGARAAPGRRARGGRPGRARRRRHRRRRRPGRRPALPDRGGWSPGCGSGSPATASWSSTTPAATSTCSAPGGRRRCGRRWPRARARRRCAGCSRRSPSAAGARRSSRERRRRGWTATPRPTWRGPGPWPATTGLAARQPRCCRSSRRPPTRGERRASRRPARVGPPHAHRHRRRPRADRPPPRPSAVRPRRHRRRDHPQPRPTPPT